jgi:hypothetical protein
MSRHTLSRLSRTSISAFIPAIFILAAPAKALVAIDSTLGGTVIPDNNYPVFAKQWIGLPFFTGPSAAGYRITEFTAHLSGGESGRNYTLDLYEADSNLPIGSALASIGIVPSGSYQTINSVNLQGISSSVLTPSSNYVLALRSLDIGAEGAGGWSFLNKVTSYQVDGGFSVTRNFVISTDAGESWSGSGFPKPLVSLSVEEVPGPLPVLGAVGAFRFSRKLRRKLASSFNRTKADHN